MRGKLRLHMKTFVVETVHARAAAVGVRAVPEPELRVATRSDAQKVLERRFGDRNVRIFEKGGVKSVRVMIAGWPVPLEVARGRHAWKALVALALEHRFTVHRERGWCIPEEGTRQPGYTRVFRRRITSLHDAHETGREQIAGVQRGARFEYVVGRRAVYARRGVDQGVVTAILQLRSGAFAVVTTTRGLRAADPIVIERALVDES